MAINHQLGNGFSGASASLSSSGEILNQIEYFNLSLTESSPDSFATQFIIPKEATGESKDTIVFYITSSGQRPLVGIGTDTPQTSFDVKEQLDNSTGVELLIRNSRTATKGADPGDAAGTLNFIIDSGSYNNIQTSGSVAKITTEVLNVTDEGAIGDLLLQTAQTEKEEPITTMRIGRNGSSLTSSLDVSLFLKAQKIAIGNIDPATVATGNAFIENDLRVNDNTLFGNTSSDTHEFNGSITASNDISASGDITGSDVYINDFGSVSASLAAASGTSDTNKSQYLYTYNYTTDSQPTPGSGNLTVSNAVIDWIVVNTSSLNDVDLDGSSVGVSFSDFLFNKAGSIITLKETGSGAFTSWSVLSIILGSNGASAGSDPDSVAFQIEFQKNNSSGSLSNGDIVEFIWDQSAAVGDLTESTLFSVLNPTYNVIDTFFGTNNLFTPTVSSTLSLSYTGSGYIATAISKSSDLTLGGLTVNGDVTTTGALEIGGVSDVSASIAAASGGGGGAVSTYTNGSNNRIITSTGASGINGESTLTYDGSIFELQASEFNIQSTTFNFNGVPAGTDNTVLILNSSNDIVTDEIDSRVWGTSLVDASGTPANNQIAVFTDNNTIEGASDFTFNAGALIVEGGGTSIFNNQNDDATFQIKGSSDDNLLQVNPQSNDRIGIGTATPSEKLSVEGNVSASSYYGDGSNLTGISGGGGLSETPLANVSGRFQWSSADAEERIHIGNTSYGPFNWYSFNSEPTDTNLKEYSAGTVDSTTAYVLDYHPVSYGIYVPGVSKKVKVRVSYRIQNGNGNDFGFSLWDCPVPANGSTSNNTVTLRAQSGTQTATSDTTRFYIQEFTTTSAVSDKYLFFLAESRNDELNGTTYIYANISFTLVD
ncbi:hypothetical protein N9F67_00010 [bacterium]|nr:hypothetical protein [bacterium]